MKSLKSLILLLSTVFLICLTPAHSNASSCSEEEQKKALEKKLNKICSSRIVAEYRVDANLVGGLLVDFDGKVIDGSLKHRLQQVKEVID